MPRLLPVPRNWFLMTTTRTAELRGTGHGQFVLRCRQHVLGAGYDPRLSQQPQGVQRFHGKQAFHAHSDEVISTGYLTSCHRILCELVDPEKVIFRHMKWSIGSIRALQSE
jgi:hypothetical protein